MKKLFWLLLLLGPASLFAQTPFPMGQPYQVLKSSTCTSSATCTPNASDGTGTATGGFPTTVGIGYYRLSWTVDGTVSACAVSIDSASNQGATYSVGGVASAATIGSCATAGSYVTSSPIYVNLVKLTPAITGTGNVTFTILGGLFPGSVSGGGTVTGTGTSNAITKWTGALTQGNSSITGDDGTHSPISPNGFDLGTLGALSNQIANNATTATVVNKLACDDGTGKVLICSHLTSTTNQPVGSVTNGAGTTGVATVAYIGFITVCFDNQTTSRDYAIASTTADGCLHDTGGTTLTAGQPNYFVWTANSGVLTNGVFRLLTADDFTVASCANCVTAAAALTNHTITLGTGGKGVKAGTLGTTTTVLHGNASGDPAYGSVVGGDMASNTVTATQLAAQYSKGSCTEVWGGSGAANAMASGDDAIVNNSCYNDSAVTRTITAVKCRSDNAANTTVLTPTFGSAGTGTAILTGTVTCGNSYAYSATGTLTNTAWTTGTGIDPGMSTVGNATSIAMIVEYTF